MLITGGAGFLGVALGRRVKALGSEIVVLDDLSTGDLHAAKEFADQFIQDRVRNESISEIRDVDVVFHLGAPSSTILFEKRSASLVETIDGMKAVLDYCRSNHVRKLIYASSSSVYGNSKLPQSEEMATQPVNEYGVAKLSCENLARIYPDVQSIGLRIFAGYGPGESKKVGFCSVIGIFLANILAREQPLIFGRGKQTRDFVFVDDIIECMLRAADTSYKGVINVGSGDSLSFLEVLNLLVAHLGREVVPRFVTEPRSYFEHTRADTTKLFSILNLEPIRAREGITKYIEQSVSPGVLKT